MSHAFTRVWSKSTMVWVDTLHFMRLARDAPPDSCFVRKYSVTRVRESGITVGPTNDAVLTAAEFSVR